MAWHSIRPAQQSGLRPLARLQFVCCNTARNANANANANQLRTCTAFPRIKVQSPHPNGHPSTPPHLFRCQNAVRELHAILSFCLDCYCYPLLSVPVPVFSLLTRLSSPWSELEHLPLRSPLLGRFPFYYSCSCSSSSSFHRCLTGLCQQIQLQVLEVLKNKVKFYIPLHIFYLFLFHTESTKQTPTLSFTLSSLILSSHRPSKSGSVLSHQSRILACITYRGCVWH